MKKYKDIIKTTKENKNKFFGLTYIYVLGVLVVLGIFYIFNLNNITYRNVLPRLNDTVATDIKFVQAKSVPPLDIFKVKEPNSELLNNGRALFNKVCASCHGEDGKGNGPGSTGLNPPPRNFTSKDGWKNGQKLSNIYKTLMEGFTGTAMIAYDYLTPEERVSLAHYIRQTFVPQPPMDTDDELKVLDQVYLISKGNEVPAQIPIKDAKVLIMGEQTENLTSITSVVNEIEKSKNELFDKITYSKPIAANWLSSNEFENVRDFFFQLSETCGQNGFNKNIYFLTIDEREKLFNEVQKIKEILGKKL